MDLASMTINDNKAESRWEAHWGDHVAVINYSLEGQIITLIRTKVPEPIEGLGVGTKLVRWALDQARADGLKVVPRCPFVAAFIKRHRDYADLVAH